MKKTIDACSAVADVAYKLSEIIPIYPITPSSPMAEFCSHSASDNKLNIFGEKVKTIEMQSEAGVTGALHGALIGGALGCTFTSSQGLLLMIPDMYKMAGECLPAVIHVAARAVASHALSIFGDHSDVMSVRMTGFNMLCSSSVQESHDFALIAHALAAKSHLPILHFFDGFRTSHEFQKIDYLTDEVISSLFPIKSAPTEIPLSSQKPLQFGTAQNPDVFFQNRLAREKLYDSVSDKLEECFDEFYALTGRRYHAFDYYGPTNAENVVVVMGSASETLKECLPLKKNCALVCVRLYRPFDVKKFISCLPKSLKKVIVLDRTCESGAREPLYLDVKSALAQSKIEVVGGIYGLGGKEFSPNEAMAVLDNFDCMIDDFSVGVTDDVSKKSLPCKEVNLNLNQTSIKIYGLGSDGSVSASKSITKILGKGDDKFVQGYFEYDSKKAGSMTVSHLRISDEPIHSTYLCKVADVIMINNFSFVHRYHCLEGLKKGGTVIFNTIFEPYELDKILPIEYKKIILDKNAKVFVINGHKIASSHGLKEKINIIMTTALFETTNLCPNYKEDLFDEIRHNFARKGNNVVENNISAAIDSASAIKEVPLKNLTLEKGDIQTRYTQNYNDLPVSAFSPNGSTITDTTRFEKRGIAEKVPEWQPQKCLQCGKCVLACPHGAIKAVLVKKPPKGVPFVKAYGVDGYYKIQVSPKDCTGCGLCQQVCPALGKAMILKNAGEIVDKEQSNFEKVDGLKNISKTPFSTSTVKGLQFEKNYFVFPGACAGCGQTPYIKVASMLFGKRMVIANATGCSSIYSGSYPSCPFVKDSSGHGPAWANSLFEDNAEFGLGIKLAKSLRGSKESVWIIGGDGWAYDIGYGGLDHLLASGENVNILVLDNECYANTGGQASKSTPAGASVKLADGGKTTDKKNLALMAMTYKNVYVASVAFGADMDQTIKAFKEAEAFNGPSLIIAYSTCVNHGFSMAESMQEMKRAVDCGYICLFRRHPERGFTLDKGELNNNFIPFLMGERRYAYLSEKNPRLAGKLFKQAKLRAKDNLIRYKQMERTE